MPVSSETTICPGCGLELPAMPDAPESKVYGSRECLRLMSELSFYTLGGGDPFFIHQVIVDTYGAQHIGPETKPIATAFGLIGLCLLLDHGFTGKEVQNAHVKLGNLSKNWPKFTRPETMNALTVADTLKTEPGEERDLMIKRWAASVWEAYAKDHAAIETLLNDFGIV